MKKAQKQKQKQKVVVNVKVGGGKEKAQQPMFIPQQSQSIGIGDVMRLIESSQKMPPMKQEVPPTNITQLNNLRPIRMDDIVATPAFNEPLKMNSNVINQSLSLDNQLIPIKTSRGIATAQTETQPMETQTEQPQMVETGMETEKERLNTDRAKRQLRNLVKSIPYEEDGETKFFTSPNTKIFKKYFKDVTGQDYISANADENLDLLKNVLGVTAIYSTGAEFGNEKQDYENVD